ncbi:hypothetical protein Val02_14050 [Virgisporangium aliadipatigenens]|uniref:Uncharacterized protein n=1 Tax=Virgisporangium aliadipatigenens TaxID=741659 RepID=A0A8J3YFZ5_9ACTN|nr:hypothetical protein [Virgisporangium aliadipatigenens]GIJ44519.1 hypothetical protein Val02_14050 [Virgisporangium aliadipatigenens]
MRTDELLFALLLVELTDAVRDRDGDRVVHVLRRLYDLNPVWTDFLVHRLITEARRRPTAN